MRFSDQNFTSRSNFVRKLLWNMVDWHHAEIVLEINQKEANWYVRWFFQVINNLCTNHQTRIFTTLQLWNVDYFTCILAINYLRNRFDHVSQPVSLNSTLVYNRVVCSWDKSYNRICSLISLQTWVNWMSCLEVLSCFTISFQIFKNCCSIEEKVRIRFFHIFFGHWISSKGTFKLFCWLIIDEEISQMCISQNIPTLRITHI